MATLERIAAARGQQHRAGEKELVELQREHEGVCLQALRDKRLIGYGRKGSENAPLQSIDSGDWNEFGTVGWNKSYAGQHPSGKQFFDIVLYPALLAPCRIDLIDGQPIVLVFKKFVLNDFEVALLALPAMQTAPEWRRVFIEGCCNPQGMEKWSIADNRWITAYFVHPDPAKRCVFDRMDADPIEVVIAAQALVHRWRLLISLLEVQEIFAEGLNNSTGALERILPAVWSHKEFYLDAKQGDLLQENPLSEGRYDRYIKRYIGVCLRQELSHVKPTALDQPPSPTIIHERASVKAAANVCMREAVANECQIWLEDEMRKSPSKRTSTKGQLLVEAQKRWPALSEKSFERAWTAAMKAAGAMAWSKAGAPQKHRE